MLAEEEEPGGVDSDTEALDNINESSILVNSASTSRVHPGGIRKLMPASNRAKAASTAVNKPAYSKTAFKSEITIDGKTRREVLKCIAYQLSQTDRSSYHSLIDMGDNGGVAGNNMRTIEKHPDKTAIIKDIHNHEVPSAPIATVGGATNTTSGEAILILN